MTHKTPEIIIQPPFCETRLVKQISSQTIIKVKLLSVSLHYGNSLHFLKTFLSLIRLRRCPRLASLNTSNIRVTYNRRTHTHSCAVVLFLGCVTRWELKGHRRPDVFPIPSPNRRLHHVVFLFFTSHTCLFNQSLAGSADEKDPSVERLQICSSLKTYQIIYMWRFKSRAVSNHICPVTQLSNFTQSFIHDSEVCLWFMSKNLRTLEQCLEIILEKCSCKISFI